MNEMWVQEYKKLEGKHKEMEKTLETVENEKRSNNLIIEIWGKDRELGENGNWGGKEIEASWSKTMRSTQRKWVDNKMEEIEGEKREQINDREW